MPKTEKRVYTYDQLDAILRRRSVKHDKIHMWMARLRSTVHVTTTYSGVGFALRHVSSNGEQAFEFARIYRVAGVDTVYCVFGLDKDKARKARMRNLYRRAVSCFTPHDIVGHTPTERHSKWFRVHDGVARLVPAPETYATGEPRNCWLGLHPITRPSYEQWLRAWHEQHPRLCNRARSFYVRLRRELKAGLPCTAQLLKHTEVPRGMWHTPHGPAMHVCVPPTERGRSQKLVLVVHNHDLHSRRHFGVDGDFGHRHAQVWGMVVGRDGGRPEVLRWKSTRDAIVGVKEWVMNSVYIPGF